MVSAARSYGKLALRVLGHRLGRRTRPLFATLFVTERCNVRCDGCVYYEEIGEHGSARGESTEDTLVLIRAIAAGGVPVLSYAGGEPFLRSDLPTLLEAGHRLNLAQTLVTNAMVLTEEGIRACDETCTEVLFSPHPPAELGGGGAVARWEASWDGFTRLSRSLRSAKLTCAITIGKHTVPHLEEILERAVAAGAERIRYTPHFFPAFFPDASGISKAEAVLARWHEREPARMPRSRPFRDLGRFFGTMPQVGCTAERQFSIGVHLDGSVSACCAAHVPIGNLFETPLLEMRATQLQLRSDCFGCHRTEVISALRVCGT